MPRLSFCLDDIANWGEAMRTDANQHHLPLKTAGFKHSSAFSLPLDAPDSVVTLCRSEAEAVRTCLANALVVYKRDQLTVAMMCGWKSDSCLSEIASERNARRMPASRRDRFATATGCNLLAQYVERQETLRKAAGKTTERDRAADLAQMLHAA